MHKYWNMRAVLMKPFLVGLLALGLSAGATPLRATDLASRIRTVAQEHDASTTTTAKGTYYQIFAIRAPAGYRTILTLLDHADGAQTIATAIYENVGGWQQVRLLVDEHADGDLEYVLMGRGRKLKEALIDLRSSAPAPPMGNDHAVYRTLVAGLRGNISE